MAYVVARPKGRFEIRESLHTPKGPRARSLANFEVLTNEVLTTARARAVRPFDPAAVLAAADRAGAPVAAQDLVLPVPGQTAWSKDDGPAPGQRDRCEVLLELLGFVDRAHSGEVARWVGRFLGLDSEQVSRLAGLSDPAQSPPQLS